MKSLEEKYWEQVIKDSINTMGLKATKEQIETAVDCMLNYEYMWETIDEHITYALEDSGIMKD